MKLSLDGNDNSSATIQELRGSLQSFVEKFKVKLQRDAIGVQMG